MDIIRKIGKYEVLIDSSEPCGIYFEESAIASATGAATVTLGRAEMLGILASKDDYLPLTCQWELLDRCNFACPFCYIVGHSFKKLVRFSEIRNQIAELIEEGLLFCTLTGGEVTIHPDFKAIYQFLKERGVIVEVYTNGYAIDGSIIDLFRSYPPITLEVSIYTLDNERLCEVYGAHDVQGASKVLENVVRLKHAGIHVKCKTFFNKTTKADIEAIVLWCKNNNVEHYSSSSITHAYDGTDLGDYAIEIIEHPLTPPENEVCLPCKTKNYGSAINASFSIYPCPSIMLNDCTYDLRQIGVAESLRRMKAFMRHFQDSKIVGKHDSSSSCASCMAYAKPVRNKEGAILHFAHP